MKDVYSYSLIPLQMTQNVIKFAIDEELCDALHEAAEKWIDPSIDCNLQNTRRTIWNLHTREKFIPVFELFVKRLIEVVTQNLQKEENSLTYKINFVDCWVAWYSSDSFVQPHSHSGADSCNLLGAKSVSAYLSVPNGQTSLTFFNDRGSRNQEVTVKKGEVLLFPSDLVHYTNDCSEGRIILSANFTVDRNYEVQND